MKDSTKQFSKMLGTDSAEKALHMYLYVKYLPHYIYHVSNPAGLVERRPPFEIPSDIEEMIEIITRKVSKDSVSRETSTYHGKIVPLKQAIDLISVNEDIELKNLEKVVPYKIARDIVIKHPLKIAVFDCACRLLHDNPCKPLDVCLAVGDPFASFLIEHEVLNARMVSVDEAVSILESEHRRGHVHGAYFKDVAGDRFYAICNCCACCCIGMKAWTRLKIPIISHSGYIPAISGECDACGECEKICPFGAIRVEDAAVFDTDLCMGCGVCEGACPVGAINLTPDSSKGEPLDIITLLNK